MYAFLKFDLIGASYFSFTKVMNFINTYSTESCKTFIAYKCLYRVNSHNNNIDSQVEFVTIEKQWFIKVSLNDDLFVFQCERKIFQLFKERNVVSLGSNLRLGDEDCVLVCLLVGCESLLVILQREVVTWRNHIELLRVNLHTKVHKVGQSVLMRKHFDIRVPVNNIKFIEL